MGRTPKPDAHRTGLQRRLADEVRSGMESTGRNQAELSRLTGIGEPHISLLLRGLRQGTISAWDKLLNAAHGRMDRVTRVPEVVPQPDVEEVVSKLIEPLGIPVLTRLPAASLNPRRPL